MILLILLLALLLRFISLDQSLWLDEAIGAIEVQKHDIPGLVNNFLVMDNHTPLYYLTLDIWTSIFGYSEISLRLPSVLFGVGTVYLVYKISRLLFKKNLYISYVVALLIATSQFHIYYSQEARMYTMAGFFAAVSIYAFLKITSLKSTFLQWIIFGLSLAALVFTDYMPVFLWPIFPIYAIYKKLPLHWWKKFLFSQIPLIILSIVWLPVLLIQINNYSTILKSFSQWKDVAGGASLKNIFLVWTKFTFGRLSLINKSAYYLLLILISLPYIVVFLVSLKKFKKYSLFFLWIGTPLVLSLVASFIFPAFNYFRFVYIYPAWSILIGIGLIQLKNNFFRDALICLILIFNLLGIFIYFTDKAQQREQWRQVMQFVEQNADVHSIALFTFPEPFAPVRWYQTGAMEIVGATDELSADREKTSQKTKNAILNKNKVYYFEYLADLSDPSRVVYQSIVDEGFNITQEYGNFIGIGKVTLFEK